MKNITQKITKHALYLMIALLVGVTTTYAIGSLTPSGTAGDNTHYSLNDIYNKLTNFSATPAATSSPFTVPGSVTASFRTLTEIYNLLTAENADLVPEKILDGTTIFGVEGTVVEGLAVRTQWSTDDQGPSHVDWGTAVSACSTLVEGGHSDWELPTSIELHNAYLEGVSGFQIDNYWSSTENPLNPAFAYTVVTNGGSVGQNTKSVPEFLVRCVR